MRNIRDIRLPDQEEASRIGELIYQNECGKQEKFLVHWNVGEEFMSLGIGHFIWYPAGVEKQFTEMFPQFLCLLISRNVTLPDWLTPDTPAPWSGIESFQANIDSKKNQQLLGLMRNTFAYQIEFMGQRLVEILPELGNAEKASTIAAGENGMYLLIDYLNFKGAGMSESERYAGQGWGLLQVLEHMEVTDRPKAAFADAAAKVLKFRITNSPPERGEARWLPGWLNRLDTYRR